MLPRKTLYTNYYIPNNKARLRELQYCLSTNVRSGLFDRIVVFCDPSTQKTYDSEIRGFTRIPVVYVLQDRPSYGDMFCIFDRNGINVVANGDVWFGGNWLPAFSRLADSNGSVAICCSRVEPKGSKQATMSAHLQAQSQDAWCVYGVPKVRPSFGLGRPGCDNRVAYLLNMEYALWNPCNIVELFHVHSTQDRTYTSGDRVDGPYVFVPPGHTVPRQQEGVPVDASSR